MPRCAPIWVKQCVPMSVHLSAGVSPSQLSGRCHWKTTCLLGGVSLPLCVSPWGWLSPCDSEGIQGSVQMSPLRSFQACMLPGSWTTRPSTFSLWTQIPLFRGSQGFQGLWPPQTGSNLPPSVGPHRSRCFLCPHGAGAIQAIPFELLWLLSIPPCHRAVPSLTCHT